MQGSPKLEKDILKATMWCSIYRSTQKIVDFIGIILERGVGGGAELLLEPAAQQLCANPADEKGEQFCDSDRDHPRSAKADALRFQNVPTGVIPNAENLILFAFGPNAATMCSTNAFLDLKTQNSE